MVMDYGSLLFIGHGWHCVLTCCRANSGGHMGAHSIVCWFLFVGITVYLSERSYFVLTFISHIIACRMRMMMMCPTCKLLTNKRTRGNERKSQDPKRRDSVTGLFKRSSSHIPYQRGLQILCTTSHDDDKNIISM